MISLSMRFLIKEVPVFLESEVKNAVIKARKKFSIDENVVEFLSSFSMR